MSTVNKKPKLYSVLDRAFFLTGRINNERTRELLEWLLEQYMLDTKQPIELHIMSYGGDPNLAFAVIDFLQQSPRPLATYALGVCGKWSRRLLEEVDDRKRKIRITTI